MDNPTSQQDLYQAFRAARGANDMLALCSAVDDAALDELTAAAGAQLATASGQEANAIRERLDSLRQLRSEQAEAIEQMRAMRSQLAALPPAEHHFLAFMAVRDLRGMLDLASQLNDDELAALDALADEKLAAAGGDEVKAIRARLESLRELRSEQADTLAGARQLRAQLADMNEDERLLLAFESAASPAQIMALVGRTPNHELDDLEAAVTAKLAAAADEEATALQQRLEDLRAWRNTEQTARRTLAALGEEGEQALVSRVVAWVEQPDWGASERFAAEHAATLLTEAGAAALTLLVMTNPDNEELALHQNLLAACRGQGSAAAYRQLRSELNFQAALASPVGQAVLAYVQADDAAAAGLLAAGGLLLTAEAQHLLDDLAKYTAAQGSDDDRARLAARLDAWQAAWRRKVSGPLRAAPAPLAEDGGLDWRLQDNPRAPEATPRGDRYIVVNTRNSAVGPGAQVLNIFDVGELPLRWQRPQETRPDLAAGAVGRAAELDDLHRRLSRSGGAAIVSAGTSAAVRGQPGIGKTVLAALYAARHADDYPGGVIWLDVGPTLRTAESAAPLLQKLAAHAYAADARSQLLDNLVFAADTVQALLAGHGRLLLVLDNVWSEAVVDALKAAAPPGSALLLTTRDYDVAFALERSQQAIQPLDVLTAADARLLLQEKLPDLAPDLADALAQGLGRHAQALTLAAGALAARKAPRYAQTVAEILARVRGGRGFGDLPRMEKRERQTVVEIALKYSYDYLGEALPAGAAQQAWFRGLGAFALESTFEPAAAAALWQCAGATAEEFLLMLDGLALVQEVQPGAGAAGRWQQHAILRAYALSLQETAERQTLAERHAAYYLDLAVACYRALPRNNDRVEMEFAQIEHAFAWCREFSPSRLVTLTNVLGDFLLVRGRSALLGVWGQAALDAAARLDDAVGKANTLQSLGDLERRLGNIEAARGHYDAALPLYEAEQARLGKANTLQSLGDLESRLGNIEAARGHYDAALPLYEAEQDPVGKMNVFIGVARMEAALGNRARADDLYQRVFSLADAIGFGQHPVTQDLRREYAEFRQTDAQADDPTAQTHLQALVDQLIAWVQIADLAEQQQFLAANAGALLTDDGELALHLLLQANPNHPLLRRGLALLRRSRELGIDAAYAELAAALNDPVQQAVAALLAAENDEELQRVLTNAEPLAAPAAIFALAALLDGALAAQDGPNVARFAVLLVLLVERYNYADAVVPVEQRQAVVEVCANLLPLAEQIDPQLAAGLREQAGWACNRLGAALADEQQDHPAALAAFTRGLSFDAGNAVLRRNRAGEQIVLNDLAAAAADIEQAAALEPDAPRLVTLRSDLAAWQGDAATLLALSAPRIAANAEEAPGYFYRSLGLLLGGDPVAARAAMAQSCQFTAAEQQRDGLDTLAKLAVVHPAHAGELALLADVLRGEEGEQP